MVYDVGAPHVVPNVGPMSCRGSFCRDGFRLSRSKPLVIETPGLLPSECPIDRENPPFSSLVIQQVTAKIRPTRVIRVLFSPDYFAVPSSFAGIFILPKVDMAFPFGLTFLVSSEVMGIPSARAGLVIMILSIVF